MKKPETSKKIFEIVDFEVKTEKDEKGNDVTKISGYANTKGTADSYGDVPKGDNVYDLSRMKDRSSARTAIIDHNNSMGSIIGRFTKLKEDEKGLYFEVRLMENPKTRESQHAIEAIKTGYGVGLSIAGRWEYGKDLGEGKRELLKAHLSHIAFVAIGADMNAVTTQERPKSEPEIEAENSVESLRERFPAAVVDMAIAQIRALKCVN